MSLNKKTTLAKYIPRPYQGEAIKSAVNFTKGYIVESLKQSKQVAFEDISLLLEMATGSGKTFTVGTYLDYIMKLRNRYNSKYNTHEFENMNVLFLTNRIDGLDQFRDNVVYGRDGETPKPTFLSDEVKKNLRVKTFHSKADNLDDIDQKYWTSDEVDEDTMQDEALDGEDTFFFSTFQTAILKELEDKIPYLDLIVIDEAHNVRGNSDYQLLLESLTKLQRGNRSPMIVPVTATPTTVTKELFGDPKFIFGLAEYLASKYSPSIDYRLITSANATPEQIQTIGRLVEEAKNIEDLKDKKAHVKMIEEKFHEIMSQYASVKELVNDLLDKRISRDPKETIIYANSIQEANQIRNEINKQLNSNIAVSYHSANDKKHTVDWSDEKKTNLEKFSSPLDETKIIIAIGKLNESVDIPTVENVVFWRDTDIEKVFLQQFGRGLRGDGVVKYFDYVGGIKNFSWIGDIYEEYMKYSSSNSGESEELSDGGGTPDKFSLSSGNVFSEEHSIDLHAVLFDFSDIQQEITKQKLTKEEIEDYFFNYEGRSKEENFEYWINVKQLEIVNIIIGGNSINKVASLVGYKYDINLNTAEGFKKFICYLFQREDNTKLTKEEIEDYFFNYEGRNKEESFEYWINVKQLEIAHIVIGGNSINKIASLVGYKYDINLNTVEGFKKFICYLFQREDNTKLTKEEIEYFFFNFQGRSKEENFDYWIRVSAINIGKIKIKRKGILKIASLYGYQFVKHSVTPEGFKEFICYLFQREDSTKLTKEEIEYFFFNYEGRSKDENFDYWMNIRKIDIGAIKIKENAITKIAKYHGHKTDKTLRTPEGFKEFICYLFQREDSTKLTKEEIEDFFFNYEGRSKDENFDYWMSIRQVDIGAIKIKNSAITKIAKYHGHKTDKPLGIGTEFKIFIKYLFGKQ